MTSMTIIIAWFDIFNSFTDPVSFYFFSISFVAEL